MKHTENCIGCAERLRCPDSPFYEEAEDIKFPLENPFDEDEDYDEMTCEDCDSAFIHIERETLDDIEDVKRQIRELVAELPEREDFDARMSLYAMHRDLGILQAKLAGQMVWNTYAEQEEW